MCAAAPGNTRPKKKARKQKEYIPGVGTAGYAFLITLFQVLQYAFLITHFQVLHWYKLSGHHYGACQ